MNIVSTSVYPGSNVVFLVFYQTLLSQVLGMIQSDTITVNSKESFAKLWIHETVRVFGDRMSDSQDISRLSSLVMIKVKSMGLDYATIDGALESVYLGAVSADHRRTSVLNDALTAFSQSYSATKSTTGE